MANSEPARELTDALCDELPGDALDLACGAGRHSSWLARRGWKVTAVDRDFTEIADGRFVQADLEKGEFAVTPDSWDLIVCWLYWQADLMPEIARGVRSGGIAALAGRVSGRFATSLANLRASLPGWNELASGEDGRRAWLIARSPTTMKK